MQYTLRCELLISHLYLEACAESKVKCNLQYPCSKCTSRGRECFFINDPETSRKKKLASSKRKLSLSSVISSSAESVASPVSSIFSESVVGSPTDFSSAFSPYSPTTSTAITPDAAISMLPPLSISPGSSSTSSSHSSPRSDFYENQPEISGDLTFDVLPFDGCPFDSYVNGAFTNTGELYFDPETLSCESDSTQPTNVATFSWNEIYPSYGDPLALGDEDFVSMPTEFHGCDDSSSFIPDYNTFLTAENNIGMAGPSPRTPSAMENLLNSCYDPASNVVLVPSQSSNAADLDLYLPLVHIATWSMEEKPLILVRAMQACGALFVRTPVAAEFIDETLSLTRDALILEFAKLSTDPREQNNLLLTVVLLQTIGLFHQKADQRISANVYHGMLVVMIRRTGVIPRVNAWLPSDIDDVQSVETAWREWANYEMIKRVLFLSYLHDCCHCMYFAIPPSFEPAELDICLPCDDALWDACNSGEWYRAVQTPSTYGAGNSRIMGFPMQTALTMLRETRLSTATVALNPFAQFILIHTVLRNLYLPHAETTAANISIPQEPVPTSEESTGNAFATQYALHNWLQIWLGSSESMAVEASQDEPPFVRNALPFYWLAQVSLIALQNASTVFGGQSSHARAEGRFKLMKEWLDHIRTVLRTGNPVPTHVWDGIMKLRPHTAVEGAMVDDEHPNGLLSFFPAV
ncbi:hypothetical protein H0H87_001793 [Tephrocybe sp. NHM501043]|nr:hypothetical protein H0H87_001793 [Tephrocybe sp. NHM501043]